MGQELFEYKESLKVTEINIVPLADRVIIEPYEMEKVTKGGIIIPSSVCENEKPQKGIVVAVGKGTIQNPTTLKVGHRVLHGKYSGNEISIDGKIFLIMRESDVIAII